MVAYGSCLFLLTHFMLPQTPLQNLQTCWKFILESYKRHGIQERYRGMNKLSLFKRKQGGPKLKGRAAQVQNLALPLAELWEKYMNPHLAIHKKILTLLRLNVAMEKIMKENRSSLAFDAEDANNFKKCGFALAQIHRELTQHFAEEEQPLFQDIPKLHAMQHSILSCHVINPRLTWCFRQEDNMNIHRTLARSCAQGLKGPAVTTKIVAKMRIALHLQLCKQ